MKFTDALKCFFGFHPRNPKSFIVGQAWYVTTCHNGDTPWYEKCPRCDCWHYSNALNEEMHRWDPSDPSTSPYNKIDKIAGV